MQARQRLAQIERAGARWSFLERLVEDRGWSDRLVIALEQSLFHGADRSSYATEAGISPATASADLRRLLDTGLVVRQSLGRTTRYTASDALRSDVSLSRRIKMRYSSHRDAKLRPCERPVTLADDVAAELQRMRRERSIGVSEALNDLVRAGMTRKKKPRKRFVQRTHSLGRTLIDYTNVAEALELAEGPDYR